MRRNRLFLTIVAGASLAVGAAIAAAEPASLVLPKEELLSKEEVREKLGGHHAVLPDGLAEIARADIELYLQILDDEDAPLADRLHALSRLALFPDDARTTLIWARYRDGGAEPERAAKPARRELSIQAAFSSGLRVCQRGEMACVAWAQDAFDDAEPRVREVAVDLLARCGAAVCGVSLEQQYGVERDLAVRRRIERRLAARLPSPEVTPSER